jgi:hypothetical protein
MSWSESTETVCELFSANIKYSGILRNHFDKHCKLVSSCINFIELIDLGLYYQTGSPFPKSKLEKSLLETEQNKNALTSHSTFFSEGKRKKDLESPSNYPPTSHSK